MGVSFSTLPLDSMLLLTGHLPFRQIEKGEFEFFSGLPVLFFSWFLMCFVWFPIKRVRTEREISGLG